MQNTSKKGKNYYSSGSDIEIGSDIDENPMEMGNEQVTENTNIEMDEYILVKFPTKKSVKYYLGQVLESNCKYGEAQVNFLRKYRNNGFISKYLRYFKHIKG